MLVASRDLLRPNSQAPTEYQKGYHFFAWGYGDFEEKQALMKIWFDIYVDDLKENHELCWYNHSKPEASKNLTKKTYFGVIDLVNM